MIQKLTTVIKFSQMPSKLRKEIENNFSFVKRNGFSLYLERGEFPSHEIMTTKRFEKFEDTDYTNFDILEDVEFKLPVQKPMWSLVFLIFKYASELFVESDAMIIVFD